MTFLGFVAILLGYFVYKDNKKEIKEFLRKKNKEKTVEKPSNYGVFIKNMKVPETCSDCPFCFKGIELPVEAKKGTFQKSYQCLLAPHNVEEVSIRTMSWIMKHKYSWCPIQEASDL